MPHERSSQRRRWSSCLLAVGTFVVGFSDAWVSSQRQHQYRRRAIPKASLAEKPPTVSMEDLTLGAPRERPKSNEYVTQGGAEVNVAVNKIQNPDQTVERMVDALDSRLGKS